MPTSRRTLPGTRPTPWYWLWRWCRRTPRSGTANASRSSTLRAAYSTSGVSRTCQEKSPYAYELDPATRRYALIGIFHDRVNLALPFEIDIDLTEIDRI